MFLICLFQEKNLTMQQYGSQISGNSTLPSFLFDNITAQYFC